MSTPHSTPVPPSRHIVGVSLKMYFTISEARAYINSLLSLLPYIRSLNIDLFIIPDILCVPSISSALSSSSSSPLLLGAPDCFWEDHGAFTGCISPSILRKELGCSIVELGHAERRSLFGETDEQVALKAAAAERNGMIPLVCIGERERPQDRNATGTITKRDSLNTAIQAAAEECKVQMRQVLDATRGEIIWAYEPVWAIGQKEPAERGYVVGVVSALKQYCEEKGRGGSTRVIYGGSAGVGTWEGLKESVDGLFLGRFAHDVRRLEEIVREVGNS